MGLLARKCPMGLCFRWYRSYRWCRCSHLALLALSYPCNLLHRSSLWRLSLRFLPTVQRLRMVRMSLSSRTFLCVPICLSHLFCLWSLWVQWVRWCPLFLWFLWMRLVPSRLSLLSLPSVLCTRCSQRCLSSRRHLFYRHYRWNLWYLWSLCCRYGRWARTLPRRLVVLSHP